MSPPLAQLGRARRRADGERPCAVVELAFGTGEAQEELGICRPAVGDRAAHRAHELREDRPHVGKAALAAHLHVERRALARMAQLQQRARAVGACESTSPERQHASSFVCASADAITFSSSPVGTPAPMKSIRTPSCVCSASNGPSGGHSRDATAGCSAASRIGISHCLSPLSSAASSISTPDSHSMSIALA